MIIFYFTVLEKKILWFNLKKNSKLLYRAQVKYKENNKGLNIFLFLYVFK